MVVTGIYNYLMDYLFYTLFAHCKNLHSLLYLTSYKTSSFFRNNTIWKVIKMNKEFCKSTSVVLAELFKALKTNPNIYFSGKNSY